MPSITASTAVKTEKTEKVQVLDLPESFKSATTVIEKKCRNLEKRKLKLDGYREELAKGRTLSDEQQQAANRYNEVVANLDLTREFIQAFEKIGIETNKEEKKRKKQEQDEKKQQEFYKLKELFWIQEVFNCLLSPEAREEFLHGYRGAPQIAENELKNLDTFFNLVSINRQNLSTLFNDAISSTATHFQLLLEGRNKPVAGTTYRELKNLVQRIIQSGYFDWKPQPEVIIPEPEPVREPEVVIQEERNREVYPNEQTYTVDTGMEYIEPAVPLPNIPMTGQVAPTYFPVDVDTDFNFIQESLIDTKPTLPISSSVPMVVPTTVPASLASMDSAVVMVHSQLPHLPYPFMPGNPAAASIYAAAAHAAANPLVATSPAMQNVISLPVVDVPTSEPATVTVTAPQTTTVSAPQRHKENQSQDAAVASGNSTWAEEPQDDGPPFNQDQNRTESNTWTNSSYRSSNNEDSGARRGNYRGGRGTGGHRGGQRGGTGGYYNNRDNRDSRGGYGGDRQGNSGNERSNYQGERNYQQQDRNQSNGGGERNGTDRGYNNRYQGNGGDQRSGESRNNYQGNQQQGSYQRSERGSNSGNAGGNGYYNNQRGGNYRGGPSRDQARGGASRDQGPRGGSSRGGNGGNAIYENRNASFSKDQ